MLGRYTTPPLTLLMLTCHRIACQANRCAVALPSARSAADGVDCTDMSAEIAAPSTIHGYQLRLPSFEGPLDVLLRLIERNQLAITDVSLAAVTEQFVAYLTTLDAAPPET